MTASRPCQAEEEREECAAPSTEGQSDPPVMPNENLWDVPHCPLGRRGAAGAGQKAWHTEQDAESGDSEVNGASSAVAGNPGMPHRQDVSSTHREGN